MKSNEKPPACNTPHLGSWWQEQKKQIQVRWLCRLNCREITGCQTWDKCSSAAQCLDRLKRVRWVSAPNAPPMERSWKSYGMARGMAYGAGLSNSLQNDTKHHKATAMPWLLDVVGLLCPPWLRTQWSVPRGPWQFAQNPSLPVIDPVTGCPLHPSYMLQSCGAICWIKPRQVLHWFKDECNMLKLVSDLFTWW